jgi:hypothetical protein
MEHINNREMRVIIRKQDRIDYIINGVCDYWGITKEELCKIASHNYEKGIRKKIAMHLLYNVADCSLKDVASALGYKSSTALIYISNSKQVVDDCMKPKTYYEKKILNEYKQILNHLQL